MKIDYAQAALSHSWLHHPVIGDPSFDAFERFGPQPAYRSEPPFEWTVNGSMFRDPVSDYWFLYLGRYPYGYAVIPEAPSHAVVMRSIDKGRSWQMIGPVFDEKPFTFSGYQDPVSDAPDVAVIYAEGRYWLAYDWSNAGSTWEHAHAATPEHDAGAALAVADRPEGPFQRLNRPIFANSQLQGKLGRFDRLYATTVLRRQQDWIAFLLCDSGPHFAWGYAVSTAPSPEGPWTFPRMILSPDTPDFYPAPVEFHPCFNVDGHVYAPATSVARNRAYQALFKAPLEAAHMPAAWEIHQAGSLFHRGLAESESDGIWGQTFHGFVHEGQLNIMYPSRDSRHFGTVQTAKAAWPLQQKDGFWLSDGVALLQVGYTAGQVSIDFAFRGEVRFFWDFHGVVGPNKAASDACAVMDGMDLDRSVSWQTQDWTAQTVTLSIASKDPAQPGCLGFICEPGSLLHVSSCVIEGHPAPVTVYWSAIEALLNAGQNVRDHWSVAKTDQARSGLLATARQDKACVKWSFEGSGFDLWLPRGPALGIVAVQVDGLLVQSINLKSPVDQQSAVVMGMDLPAGRHAVMLMGEEGHLAADCLAVRHSIPAFLQST